MLVHRIICICCHNKCFDLSITLCASLHPSNGKCNGRASGREETCQLKVKMVLRARWGGLSLLPRQCSETEHGPCDNFKQKSNELTSLGVIVLK